jgi:hypothetical protein
MAKAFKDMSLDELIEHRSGIKQQIDALHDEARAAKVMQDRLVHDEHVERARESMQAWADKNGKTLEQAIEYWEGRLATDPISGNVDTGRWVQSLLLQGTPGKVGIG